MVFSLQKSNWKPCNYGDRETSGRLPEVQAEARAEVHLANHFTVTLFHKPLTSSSIRVVIGRRDVPAGHGTDGTQGLEENVKASVKVMIP